MDDEGNVAVEPDPGFPETVEELAEGVRAAESPPDVSRETQPAPAPPPPAARPEMLVEDDDAAITEPSSLMDEFGLELGGEGNRFEKEFDPSDVRVKVRVLSGIYSNGERVRGPLDVPRTFDGWLSREELFDTVGGGRIDLLFSYGRTAKAQKIIRLHGYTKRDIDIDDAGEPGGAPAGGSDAAVIAAAVAAAMAPAMESMARAVESLGGGSGRNIDEMVDLMSKLDKLRGAPPDPLKELDRFAAFQAKMADLANPQPEYEEEPGDDPEKDDTLLKQIDDGLEFFERNKGRLKGVLESLGGKKGEKNGAKGDPMTEADREGLWTALQILMKSVGREPAEVAAEIKPHLGALMRKILKSRSVKAIADKLRAEGADELADVLVDNADWAKSVLEAI